MERSKAPTAMKRIRIGKDFSMRWEITTDGVAMPLEGRDLTVELKSPIGTVSNIPFRVDGNVIIMTYYGNEQTLVGEYSVTLWENKGKPGQNVVDAIRAFKLVRTSQEEEDFIGGDLQVECVDLGTANLDILLGSATPGDSPDLSALKRKVDANTTRISSVEDKNTEQDTRLEKIENSVSHLSAAGRYWNEANGTPTAAGHYGSLDALRSLPEKLGLGRYLVKDDRTRRKLDPKDSTKYANDGTDAKLDGTDGQCMWCWNGFYANVWKEGDNLFKVVSFDRPVGNDISIWIPAGGISWLGAGVIDRGDAPYTDKTKWKLCSVINNSEQFRGGGGTALDASKYTIPPADSPQITMLGMPATMMSTTLFGEAARRRGDGWEANWFVARFVVEFLFEVIMGTENSQEAFNDNKDSNGLYQGGFGIGLTEFKKWIDYNYIYPVIPTSVGLEAGDGVCLVPYEVPKTDGIYHTFNVPVFFGLVGAGYGNLQQWIRGLITYVGEEKSLVYVAPSMYADYNPNTVEDKIMVTECSRVSGYITRKSYRGLCCMPTEVSGSANVRYSDYAYLNVQSSKGLRPRLVGGDSGASIQSGESCTYIHIYYNNMCCSASLCYFTEDPIIPESQSIANNS